MVVMGTSCSLEMPARRARWFEAETKVLKASWSSFEAGQFVSLVKWLCAWWFCFYLRFLTAW